MIQTQCPECQRINPVKAQDPRTIRPELQCAACLVCNRVYNVQTHLAPQPPTPPAAEPDWSDHPYQDSPCDDCGHPIDTHQRTDNGPVCPRVLRCCCEWGGDCADNGHTCADCPYEGREQSGIVLSGENHASRLECRLELRHHPLLALPPGAAALDLVDGQPLGGGVGAERGRRLDPDPQTPAARTADPAEHDGYHMLYRRTAMGGGTEVVYGPSAEEAIAALSGRSVQWDDLRIVHATLCWCQPYPPAPDPDRLTCPRCQTTTPDGAECPACEREAAQRADEATLCTAVGCALPADPRDSAAVCTYHATHFGIDPPAPTPLTACPHIFTANNNPCDFADLHAHCGACQIWIPVPMAYCPDHAPAVYPCDTCGQDVADKPWYCVYCSVVVCSACIGSHEPHLPPEPPAPTLAARIALALTGQLAPMGGGSGPLPEGYTFTADLIPCAHCRRPAKGKTLTARCNGVLYCSDCDPGPMIRLQAIGWQRAVPAAEVQPGDVLLWNYGSRTMVHRIEQRGRWLHFTLCSANRDTWGDTHERKMAPHRLVATERAAARTEGATLPLPMGGGALDYGTPDWEADERWNLQEERNAEAAREDADNYHGHTPGDIAEVLACDTCGPLLQRIAGHWDATQSATEHTHPCPTCHQARPCPGTTCTPGTPRECATCSNTRGW